MGREVEVKEGLVISSAKVSESTREACMQAT